GRRRGRHDRIHPRGGECHRGRAAADGDQRRPDALYARTRLAGHPGRTRYRHGAERRRAMIPAQFDYTRPGSLDEAVRALADGGEDAKVIAGGQSLLPLLRLRLAYPELLVDVGGLDELRGVTDAGDTLLIGARTTLYQLVHDP